MRVVAGAIVILFLWAGGARAGIGEALDAYHKSDFAGAIAACKSAAEQGDAGCQNLMGILYSEGRGVQKNEPEAARWFRKAAEQGHGQACFNLGRAYHFGLGVKQSNDEAAKWYGKAADLHIAHASSGSGC